MAYEEFSIEKIQNDFSILIEETPNLLNSVEAINPSERLVALLAEFIPLGSAIGTEKARSEFIIAPILAEVKKLTGNKVSLFSGNRFDVDKAGLSLKLADKLECGDFVTRSGDNHSIGFASFYRG
jgi:hypothetical protein